jgi:hypothetical protein
MQKYDLIICVYACDTMEKYKKQIIKINETWGLQVLNHNIKLLFFLGEEVNELIGENYIHLPNVKNDYLSASYKQFLGLKYIYEKYNAKFVLCCGTDTYINIKKLMLFISNLNESDNLYIGGHGSEREICKKKIYFHSGGPGFILTNGCLKKLYPLLDNITDNWIKICSENNTNELIPACDVAIAFFLQLPELETTIIKIDDYSFINCNHRGMINCYEYAYPCCGNLISMNKIISCHSMSLQDFDEFTHILIENNYFLSTFS